MRLWVAAAGGRMGGAVRGDMVVNKNTDFPGRIRPADGARGPGARRGWMGPEVGPAFQRLPGRTLSPILGVRFHFLFKTIPSSTPPAASRTALWTAARARAGTANDMSDTKE
eukprot:gene12878-biopygen3468